MLTLNLEPNNSQTVLMKNYTQTYKEEKSVMAERGSTACVS